MIYYATVLDNKVHSEVRWRSLEEARASLERYPRCHVLPTGGAIYSESEGPENGPASVLLTLHGHAERACGRALFVPRSLVRALHEAAQ